MDTQFGLRGSTRKVERWAREDQAENETRQGEPY